MQIGIERRMMPHVPWGLLITAVALSVIGIWNLVSASRPPHTPVWQSQALYLCFGLAAVALVALVEYRFVQQLAIPIYVLNILMLLALYVIGHKAKGALSWFAIGPFRVQPAEFMKIGMVMALALFFFRFDYKPQDEVYSFLRLVGSVVISLIPILIVLVQPDLGTALMMLFTATTLILFARVRWWVVAVMAVTLALGAVVIWNDYVREQPEGQPRKTLVRHFLKEHQDKRISSWLYPDADVKGAAYHAAQSKIAVGSGGLTGKGWMKGTQTGLFFLPEQHTDFIFSVWAEEHGFLSCMLLLILYGALFVFSMGVAVSARDRFGGYLAVGVAAMIFWQVFENIGMVTGLLPVTGITLPLMSYGGSSMLSVFVGIGLLVNISMRRHIF